MKRDEAMEKILNDEGKLDRIRDIIFDGFCWMSSEILKLKDDE